MTERPDDPQRRRFLQLMAASAALAGGACSGPPPEHIVPTVALADASLAAGEPRLYATALARDGYAHGVLVETHSGRATKVEGNPDHPASLGGSDPMLQASILDLWSPGRSRTVWSRDAESTRAAFDAALAAIRPMLDSTGGEGLRILTGPTTSPTMLALLARVTQRHPGARWHAYSPVSGSHAIDGARLAFGRPLDAIHDLAAAREAIVLDADPITDGPAAIVHARAIADARREGRAAVRVRALESTRGLAGANADERLALPPAEIERVLWRAAAIVGAAPADAFPRNAATAAWEAALAKAMRDNPGAFVLLPGPRLGAASIALAHRLHQRFGCIGRTVRMIEPVIAPAASIAALAEDMHAGRVTALLAIDVNPVYDAPAALRFAEAMQRGAFAVHCGEHRDETARVAAWHLPMPHPYETWSDLRAFDGTLSIAQPVMRPAFAAVDPLELLAAIAGGGDDAALAGAAGTVREPATTARSIVRATHPGMTEPQWIDALRRGVVAGTASKPVDALARGDFDPPSLSDAPLVAVFTTTARMHDGRHADNGWLQELPQPLTGLVWDNALLLGSATARSLAVVTGDVVSASVGGRTIECPVCVAPGHAEGVATLQAGYGRRAAGDVGNGIGYDAYALVDRDFDAPAPITIARTGRRHPLVVTRIEIGEQPSNAVRSATLAEFRRDPRFATARPIDRTPTASLYPPVEYPVHAWGMSIDLNACIGCGACTMACQAENNIPVVGKVEVARGREMHWIRVDHHRSHERDAFMPVPCMHCENAPCEEVCPVGATLHDSEGLNLQVYNRCVGTRFCNQNCPYKVRRFNFLRYSERNTVSLEWLRNPEVTVRERGVMEKCTYCVQRISRARIRSERDGGPIADGDVVTACQSACPTRAIRFGDLNDSGSDVRRAKSSPLDYALLAELNTRPRTTYLAKVRNPDEDAS